MSNFTLNPAKRARGPARGGCLVSGLVIAAILLFVASMTTVIVTIAIWPGEAKLTAPFLCPDGQPDAFVVADTYQVQPGETTTNFTLYCMGPRGDFTDVGFGRSFAILTVFHGLIVVLLVVLAGVVAGVRKRRRGESAGGEPSPPIVAPDSSPDAPPDPPDHIERRPDNETDFIPPGPMIS